MRPIPFALVLLASAGLATTARPQGAPELGPRGRPPRPVAAGAEFFLARTGELRLTDAQVVRLAAIARRSADRRRAMRASMDSLATRLRPGIRGDSADRAARRREAEQMRARFEREREQARADLRDALAVLTADQQAMAWEMTARRGPGARGARFRPERGGRPGRRSDGRPRGDRERSR